MGFSFLYSKYPVNFHQLFKKWFQPQKKNQTEPNKHQLSPANKTTHTKNEQQIKNKQSISPQKPQPNAKHQQMKQTQSCLIITLLTRKASVINGIGAVFLLKFVSL